MWPNNQWQWQQQAPINQAHYENMPHDQVDWAALAKQWMAHKEGPAPPSSLLSQAHDPPPPPPPSNYDAHPPSIPIHILSLNLRQEQNDMDISDEESGVHSSKKDFDPPQHAGSWRWKDDTDNWQPPRQNWEMNDRIHHGNEGNFEYPQTNDFSSGGTGDFYHYDKKEDYNNRYWDNDDRYTSNHSDQYNKGSPYSDIQPSGQDDSGIDAQKRKNLPSWIRDGLEKMERDKLKAQEKEKREKDKQSVLEANRKAEGEVKEKNGEPLVMRKSRFDSDNEDEKDTTEILKKISEARGQSPEVYKTEEEKQQEILLKVKHWLMEILLDVTSQEVQDVAKEVFYKAKNKAQKAPAKQLATSSALASISALGLGYDSDSGGESEAREDSEDSDADLEEKIRQKREDFDKKHQIFSDSEDDGDVSKNTEKADFIKNPVSENLTLLFQNKYSNNIPGLSQTQHDENTDSCNSHSNDSKSKSKLKSKKHSSSSSEDSSSDSSSDLENNESSSTVKTSSDESSQSAEKLRTERKASPPHFKKKNRHDSSKSLNKQNKRDNRKHGFEASSRKDEIKDTKQSSHKHGYGSDDTKHRIRKYDYDTDGYKDRRSKDKNLDKEKIRSGEYISKRGMSKDRYRSRSRSRGKHHKSYDYKRYKHEDLQNRIVDKKFSKKNPTYVDEASCSKSKSRKRNHSRSLSEDDEYSKYHRRSSKDYEPRSRRKSGRSKYEDSGKRSSFKHRSRS